MNFKVGDWVRIFGRPTRILRVEGDTEEPEYYDTSYGYRDGCLESKGLELWKPRILEWCWYGFELVQVIDVDSKHIKICRQQSDSYEEILVSSLEPFINELPSFIKEMKI